MFKEEVLKKYGVKTTRSLTIIRYADDIVILHQNKEIIIYCKKKLNAFLLKMGLRLNENKTKIVHTLNFDSCNVRGFIYLGFHIRQLPVRKYKRSKMGRLYKTLIISARESVSNHMLNLKLIIKKATKREVFISQLNPKIIG